MLLVRVRQRPEVRAPISQEISQQEVNVEGILPGVRLARTEVVIMEMVITGVVITEVVIMEVVFREGVSHMVVFQEGVLGAFLVVEDFQVGFLEAEAFQMDIMEVLEGFQAAVQAVLEAVLLVVVVVVILLDLTVGSLHGLAVSWPNKSRSGRSSSRHCRSCLNRRLGRSLLETG